MNQKILNMFDSDSDDFDIDKQFDLIELLQDDEKQILNYIDEFIYLLNHVYLDNGADAELELFMETIEPEILIPKVLKTFEFMDKIETVFDWNNFLFDRNYLPYTLEHLDNIKNKDAFRVYMEKSKNDLKVLSDSPVVKERINNLESAIEHLKI